MIKQKFKAVLRWGFVILGVLLALSLVRSISRIVGSGEKVKQAQADLDRLKKENADLTKELSGLQSVGFIEKQARDKLGLARKGEIVVILPDEDKLRQLAPELSVKHYDLPKSNWEKWIDLFK
jgi:cell division protein FtsB